VRSEDLAQKSLASEWVLGIIYRPDCLRKRLRREFRC
jgi:hypothetical protein